MLILHQIKGCVTIH